MKNYKNLITLKKNNRGCYIIDTIMGCINCNKENPNGCYDNCYGVNMARIYNYHFSKFTLRDFYHDDKQLYMFNLYDDKHENQIIKKIKNIEMPFIRIGNMGDPSQDWEHTIDICEIISKAKKPIVIITKHLRELSKELLDRIKKMNIIINTSISALDNDYEIEYRLNQYDKLKEYCKSILRIVSCDFNKSNYEGYIKANIQEKLFKNDKIIDTIFRTNLDNLLVKNKIINIKKVKFLKSYVWASIYNKNTYFDDCSKCPEMCGINL